MKDEAERFPAMIATHRFRTRTAPFIDGGIVGAIGLQSHLTPPLLFPGQFCSRLITPCQRFLSVIFVLSESVSHGPQCQNLVESKLLLLAAARYCDNPSATSFCALAKASGGSMIRKAVAILAFLAVAACSSAPIPATWARTDGRVTDPAQLEADGTICRGEMEQAGLVTNARGLVPIQLPGQENPLVKVYIGCMARHGYTAAKSP
jgi:hypothetical protein